MLHTSEQHTTAMAQMQADDAKASRVLLAYYAPIAKFPKWMVLQKKG